MYLVPRVKAPTLIMVGGFMAGYVRPACSHILSLIPRITSLLYATCPPYLLYWKWEFIAQLCLPWGIDLYVIVPLLQTLEGEADTSVSSASETFSSRTW
jgi:hypothetical protein